jgi:hypothetical protein
MSRLLLVITPQEVKMRKTSLMAVAFVVAALAVLFTAGSAAAAGDKNRDGIPDKWEKQNHLSLAVNQAPKDQDHDGLSNAGEFRDRTNPRDADTDNDGVKDGKDGDNHDGDNPGQVTEPPAPPTNGDGLPGGNDQAGTVASYEDGVLTIEMFKGGTVSGRVTSDTRFRCTPPPGGATHSSEPASGGDHPGTEPGDDPGTTNPGDEPGDTNPGDEPGDTEPGDEPGDGDHNPDGETPCGTADLVAGMLVHEANLEDGGFVLLVLVK